MPKRGDDCDVLRIGTLSIIERGIAPMNNSRGTLILSCALLMILTVGAGNLNATPIQIPDPILSINAHLVDTLFVPSGGKLVSIESTGFGVLTLQKTTAVTVVRTSGTTTTTDFFSLITYLQNDLSAGGLADGLFSGGTISLLSADLQTTLLTADVQTLELEEPFNDMGILAGSGTFIVTGGDYQADFGNAGRIVQITFRIVPKVMDDFSNTFTGTTDLTLTPLQGEKIGRAHV